MLKPRKKYHVRKVYPVAEHKFQIQKIIEFGLKNKAEYEKFNAILKKYRQIVFTYKPSDAVYISAVTKLLKKEIIPDVEYDLLNLTIDSFLSRRLQSVVLNLKLATTIHEARRQITDGHIFIDGIKNKRPSFLVNINSQISYT